MSRSRSSRRPPRISGSDHAHARATQSVLDRILAVPGSKILTLLVAPDQIEGFDIDAQGVIGYSPLHATRLKHHLEAALAHGGGALLRQFLPMKVERLAPNGQAMWLPEKNLYGIQFGQGTYVLMDPELTRLSSNTDAVTGQPLPPEEGVHFPPWPVAANDDAKPSGPHPRPRG